MYNEDQLMMIILGLSFVFFSSILSSILVLRRGSVGKVDECSNFEINVTQLVTEIKCVQE